MSRIDVVRQAMLAYHRRDITLGELMRILADWRQ